jgi:hypothetical protein
MEFTVPKFIEKESRIVGPLTFKQFIFVGLAGAISVFLYFILPFYLFIIIAIILFGGSLALAFLKIGKTSLPSFIANFFVFLFKPRIYLWKKKTSPPKFLKKEKPPLIEQEKEKEEEKTKLKVSRGSRLDELFTRVETKQ